MTRRRQNEALPDREVEQREVACASLDLQFRPNRPDVAMSQRRFRPYQLALFQGGRRDGFAELVDSLSFMISLPVRGTDQFAMGTPRAGTV